jgi:drug/metabolite transporter (DMT)-like permease
MTPLIAAGATVAQFFMVGGQLFMKRSMMLTHRQPVPRQKFAALFALGILGLTLYFLLWIGLMQYVEISRLYPFDALAPVLLVVATTLFLKEKLTPRAWLGITLIVTGLVLISL